MLAYSVGCVTKHFNSFRVLLMGRMFCGVATSLLNSAFESWLVAEHSKVNKPTQRLSGHLHAGTGSSNAQTLTGVTLHAQRNYEEDWLGGTFSAAIFVGNGVAAIVSGFLAHTLVEGLGLGPVAPFDAAHAVLLLGGALVALTWTENYGQDSRGKVASSWGQIWAALRAVQRGGAHLAADGLCGMLTGIDWTGSTAQSLMGHAVGADPKIALLGAMQSLFEASLYTFVFLWTPALAPHGERLPHGMIFACFMMACMAGSAIAGRLLSEPKRHPVSHYMKVVATSAPFGLCPEPRCECPACATR